MTVEPSTASSGVHHGNAPAVKDVRVRSYIRKCQQLKRDLQHLIQDLKFIHEQNGEVRYAVDFSEIYAYALPHSTAAEFALFSDGSESTGSVVQRLALRKLLLDSSRPILLGEYALELEGFLFNYRHKAVREAVTGALAWERSNPEEREQVARFQQALEQAGESVDSETLRTITEFLQERAGWLFMLMYPLNPEPVERVKYLLREDRFENLSDLLDVDPWPEERVVDRWFTRLKQQRSKNRLHAVLEGEHNGDGVAEKKTDAVSRLDALAVATVRQANLHLRGRNTRLLLVTRSNAMHKVSDHEERAGLWNGFGGGVLRHPRVFSVLYTIEGVPHQQALTQLRERAERINLFLHSVRKSGAGLAHERQDVLAAKLQADFETLGEYFMAKSGLAIALDETTPERSRQWVWDKGPNEVRRVLETLRDTRRLRGALMRFLGRMEDQWDLEHAVLGVYIHTYQPDKQAILTSRLVSKRKFGKGSQWRATVQAMPYALNFGQLDQADSLLQQFRPEQRPVTSWSEQLQSYWDDEQPVEVSPGLEYERLLAFAYILAVLSEWEMAEHYCDAAIAFGERCTETIALREAWFLLAVCRRKWRVSADRLLDGIRKLDCASEELERASRGALDPRYLKEKATQILSLRLEFQDKAEIPEELTPHYALDLLQRAEAMTGDDKLLRIQIVNNRLFYYLEAEGSTNAAPLQADYDTLRALQSEIEHSWENWPPFVLDTIAWADWVLHRVRDERGRARILAMLGRALESEELEPIERLRYERHRSQVECWQPEADTSSTAR